MKEVEYAVCKHCGRAIWTSPVSRMWLSEDAEGTSQWALCSENVSEYFVAGLHKPGQYVLPLAVGSVVATAADIMRLPSYAVLINENGSVRRVHRSILTHDQLTVDLLDYGMDGDEAESLDPRDALGASSLKAFGPYTVAWLPEGK